MKTRRTGCRLALGAAALGALLACAGEANAAPPWVDRTLTLPRGDWAFNLGLGIAHARTSDFRPGFNLELGVGLTREIELGVRTGLRFTRYGGGAHADAYGRTFDTETFGDGSAPVANPEILLRAALIEGQVVELGLEGRAYVPFDTGFGLMVGLPLAFHLGRAARIDTGVYVPVLFYDPTRTLVSFPYRLWFQLTNRLWLGPLAGVRFRNHNDGDDVDVSLGFGLGYSVTHAFD